jgi:hypothetical protein
MAEKKDLMEIALRVLADKVGGLKPRPEDVQSLKQSALPEEAGLDTDRIACQVIAREIQKRKARRAKE